MCTLQIPGQDLPSWETDRASSVHKVPKPGEVQSAGFDSGTPWWVEPVSPSIGEAVWRELMGTLVSFYHWGPRAPIAQSGAPRS